MNKAIHQIIETALAEDGVHQDITTTSLIAPHQHSQAYIMAKEEGVVSGMTLIPQIYKKINSKVKCHAYFKDGDRIEKNNPVMFITGPSQAILSGERVSLNFLGHLSGIASLTARFVKAASTKVNILDTRKTTPGLRILERLAVFHGGGSNHRYNLTDMVLIKDNHRIAKERTLSLSEAVKLARKITKRKVEIEVDTLSELKEVLPAKPDFILLDNMTPGQIKQAIKIKKAIRSTCLLEASGGINLKNIKKYAATGVDRISIGRLTHSATSLDFSLEFVL